MGTQQRIVSVDALRGLAVLLMVLVHAAATWEPQLSGAWLMFGVVVSGAGGLAAPLFVALLGWGLFQRKLSMPQRTWRAGFLCFCQGIVNRSAPHLFDVWTPGVLSLLGLLVLTEGVWVQPFRRSEAPARAFALTALAMVGATHAMHAWQGPSIWNERVVVDGPVEWFQHLVATGLYPLFPWITFAAFGASVAACNERQRRGLLTRTATVAFSASLVVLVQSVRNDVPWALPTGNASLTFFPANAAFLIAALAGTALFWLLTERIIALHGLADLGQASLPVYVVHFVPFAWAHRFDELHAWAPLTSCAVVVGYTLCWVVLGTWWRRTAPEGTLESLMRRYEPA